MGEHVTYRSPLALRLLLINIIVCCPVLEDRRPGDGTNIGAATPGGADYRLQQLGRGGPHSAAACAPAKGMNPAAVGEVKDNTEAGLPRCIVPSVYDSSTTGT